MSKWNSTTKIKADGRPWLILVDYHTEGFAVYQFASLQEAMKSVMRGTYGTESAIAYLPEIDLDANFKAFATLEPQSSAGERSND